MPKSSDTGTSGGPSGAGGEAVPAQAATLDRATALGVIKEAITAEKIRTYVERYTSLQSRHIRHPGNAVAASDLLADLSDAGTTAELCPFHIKDVGTFDNVEGTLAGAGELEGEIVLVAAHLDSTAAGEPGYLPAFDPAPGADDDASGIAAVLAAAHALVALAGENAGVPRRTVRFVLFNAEEEGQAGSRDYAGEHSDNVKAVFDMDMIAYNRVAPRRFELHAGYSPECPPLGSDVQARSLVLANLVREVALEVSPNLEAQIYPLLPGEKGDPAQHFGDHTSFHMEDIAACLISEDFVGTKVNPHDRDVNADYHLREDTIADNPFLDWDYAADIARAVAGAAWIYATTP